MKVAICDEEKENSALLRRLIRQEEPDCEVVCFNHSRQFLEARQHFDILLLDIQMEGMRGIEVARAIRMKEENTILIFVTALKEYVPEAFDVSAFHYLLKPVAAEKFCKVFGDACREVRRLEDQGEEQLFFRTKTRSFTLLKKDILYVESRKRKVEIHMPGEMHTVYATMKYMEEQLGKDFYRCHRGYLVNMAYVSEYGEGVIRLQNGEGVYVAREKYAEFVKAYTQYIERAGNVRSVSYEKVRNTGGANREKQVDNEVRASHEKHAENVGRASHGKQTENAGRASHGKQAENAGSTGYGKKSE